MAGYTVSLPFFALLIVLIASGGSEVYDAQLIQELSEIDSTS